MIDFYKSNLTEEMRVLLDVNASSFELISGVVILHDYRDWSVVFMSKRGLNQLGLTLKQLCNLSNEEYRGNYFNPEDNAYHHQRLSALLQKDFEGAISYYQQVRFTVNGEWVWHLSSTTLFGRDADGNPLMTLTVAIPLDTMHKMSTKADRLLEENNFLRKNHGKFSTLSKRELVILREVALGKSSIEISNNLCISSTTVDTHRRNIREKLNTKSSFEISQYARAFDLI